jgi:hypothetical protein
LYCSSCGLVVTHGLTFCNHCGARLNPSSPGAEPREVRPEVLIGAMATLFIFGLFAISLLVLLLSDGVHLGPGAIMGFTWVSLLILAALEAVFVRLLFRRQPRMKETNETNQLPKPVTKELQAMADRDLSEPVPSVTEHTTRAFDPVYSRQVKK